jgi:hypothetical protein
MAPASRTIVGNVTKCFQYAAKMMFMLIKYMVSRERDCYANLQPWVVLDNDCSSLIRLYLTS